MMSMSWDETLMGSTGVEVRAGEKEGGGGLSFSSVPRTRSGFRWLGGVFVMRD